NVSPPVRNLPPKCQAIIETDKDFKPNSHGLLRIRDGSLRPMAKDGGDFLANQQLYKDDLSRFISSSRDHIAKHGIDSFNKSALSLFKGNDALKARIAKSIAPFQTRVINENEKIKKELKKVGYIAPDLDKNFTSDFNAFKADSKEYFRKKFVNECVTNGRNGLTIDPKDILNALRQESTNNQG